MTKEEYKLHIAAAIVYYIKLRGLNKKKFASSMGVNVRTVTRWLDGKHNFDLDTLLKIQTVLEMKIINVN